MCKVSHVHYTCGHIRTMEEECAVAVEADIPIWIKSFCGNYSVSSTHIDGKKCGAGEFYCKMIPDGEYLDHVCVEFNRLKPNLLLWNNRIKSITAYADKLKTTGFEALQAGHSTPVPTAEFTQHNYNYAQWNRAQVLQKLTSLSNTLKSAREYYLNRDRQQAAGLETIAPAFMLGYEAQPRVPMEIATFAATRSLPGVFAGTGAVPMQPAQATCSVVASDYGPSISRFGADEPHAPAVAHHALATLNQATPTNDQAALLHRQLALKYAQTTRSPTTASTNQQRTAPMPDLTEETPTKACQPKGSQRKRKTQTPVEEHTNVRRSTRVAKKVNYAEEGGSEGLSSQAVVSSTGKSVLISDVMPASTTSSSPRRSINPSPLRQSSVADVEPSPLRSRNQAPNLQYLLGNYKRQSTGLNTFSPAIDSELSPERRASVHPNLISGSAALNSKLQQARTNPPSANTMQALSTLYMQQASKSSLIGRPLSTMMTNEASGPLSDLGTLVYSTTAAAFPVSATTAHATVPGTALPATATTHQDLHGTLSALSRPIPAETQPQDYASLRRSFTSGLSLPPSSSGPLPNPLAPATDPFKPAVAASSTLLGAERPELGWLGGFVDEGTADAAAADGPAGDGAGGAGVGGEEDDGVDWSMLNDGAWEE